MKLCLEDKEDFAFARRLEEVSLNAWPALQQILFDGWLLRFSDGYTKRINSVQPFYSSTPDIEAKLRFCENAYSDRGLPTIFRITPFNAPPHLDRLLDEKGYERLDLTTVCILSLRYQSLPDVAAGAVEHMSQEEGIEAYIRLSALPEERQSVHRKIVEAIPTCKRFISIRADNEIVACGMGVQEAGFFGLFNLMTSPSHRRKGYGTQLLAGLLRHAQEAGAETAYLQVTESNAAARSLYTRFGFAEAYPYWYRIRGQSGP